MDLPADSVRAVRTDCAGLAADAVQSDSADLTAQPIQTDSAELSADAVPTDIADLSADAVPTDSADLFAEPVGTVHADVAAEPVPTDSADSPRGSGWTDGSDLQPSSVAAVEQLLDAGAAVDGVAALGGHVLEALGTTAVAVLLAAAPDGSGRLAGVVAHHAGDPAEVLVHPAERRRGLGRELVAAALLRAGGVWAHGDLPAARGLAARSGLVRSRELVRMAAPLGPDLPEPRWPEGVRVRTFRVGQDEEEFLAVNARAFSWHPEQGRLDLAGLRVELAQPWFDPAGFFLAVAESGRLLGFHWTKVHSADSALGRVGEVFVLAVDPLSEIRGLGRPLTLAGLKHLAEQQLSTVILYAEGDNVRALRLYRNLGFEVVAADVVYERPAESDRAGRGNGPR